MNFVEKEGGYGEKGEQEEDEEEEMMMMTSKLPFSSPSPSCSSIKYQNFLAEHALGTFESQRDHKHPEPALNFDKKLELMELSLGNNVDSDNSGAASSGSIKKEHMFDKVVTPSDVGKLNRLVIPKQHAEKYFPLDSSSNENGLLLNFEDRNGKAWRFRYSYWNSSQSYVMTKGWSRFVKEKKLDAGDVVSFQRGVGEEGKHRLYIDWRRRPNAPDPTSFTHFELQNSPHFPQSSSVRWGRLYSLPQSLTTPHQSQSMQHLNYSNILPYNHHQYHYHPQQQPVMDYHNAAPQYYLGPSVLVHHQIGATRHHQQGGDNLAPMVIDSVPVVHGKTVAKRLRLFGVNMECPTQDESSSPSSSVTIPHGTMGSLPPPQLMAPNSTSSLTTMQTREFSKKGKSTSLTFDLDL